MVFIKKAPGVSTPDALAAVKTVTRDYPGTKVQDQAGFKDQVAKQINQILALVYALLLSPSSSRCSASPTPSPCPSSSGPVSSACSAPSE